MPFPANHPLVISVGATIQNDTRLLASNFGAGLFITAAGINILTTTLNSNYTNFLRTSASAPIVSGVIALMYSVNPCLTQDQVKNILKDTAEKVGGYNYQWNPDNLGQSLELGYGRISSFHVVQAAQGLNPYNLDLMIKDSTDDVGVEPNSTTQYMWTSTDIWIRNSDDDGLEHQNPEYDPTNPTYAYIRVKNKSCIPSSGTEAVTLNWAKAGSSLSWPASWDGLNYFPAPSPAPQPNIKFGDLVGATTIPVLQPGQETIIKMRFIVPNPQNYSWFKGSDQWHFCLLARIEAAADSLTETTDLYTNVKNNNGIAWKNVTTADVESNLTKGTIAEGNPSDIPRTFFLEFVVEVIETGKPIFEEAEVGIKMDTVLFDAWVRGGNQAAHLDNTVDQHRKIVNGNNVILGNIAFNANEVGSLTLDFNFLTEELTEKPKFRYHIVQRDAVTNVIMGGETYEIKKKARRVFVAAAPDTQVDLHQPITIRAQDINEPAIYNWYDEQGVLIFEGKDLQIANAIAEKYKLEVIATTDGFKDYTEVEISLKPSKLENITPNPATNNALVKYKLNGAQSAYLMVIDFYNNSSTVNNYILDVNSTETNLNISTYLNGLYTVALIVDGVIFDAKTLIKH